MNSQTLRRLLFLAGALALPHGAARAALTPAESSPVAVMPFKNLNSENALDWLEAGIAETMVSDLRKGGKVTVVERDQIDRAMKEADRQKSESSDELRAARVGKLVGARTIVLGSFQQADKQVRINARFVSVETGVVLDSAKTTGPIEKIFALQDEVVDKLLGTAKPQARPRRKETPRAVEAYRLYAMSLVTATDAERISLLRQSCSADPEFSYAVDELSALERRMNSYLKIASEKMLAHEANLRKVMSDPKAEPNQRVQAATTLLTNLLTSGRIRTLLKETERILDMEFPGAPFDPKELALFHRINAWEALRRDDQALSTGEEFMKAYPTSMYFSSVQMKMNATIAKLRREDTERSQVDGKLAKAAAEIVKLRESGLPHAPMAIAGQEFARCGENSSGHRPDAALAECRDFQRRYAGSTEPGIVEFVWTARFLEIHALLALGKFTEARETAERLIQENPERASTYALQTQLPTWPKD